MEYAVLGWPPDGPKLRLDHEQFSYAGKFVMTTTGKAVAREPTAGPESDGAEQTSEPDSTTEGVTDTSANSTIVGAVAFNEDRTDPDTLWLRYITVRADRRGEGIGPGLAAFVTDRAGTRGYERCQIAVNNAFAYEALYRAGFAFTGDQTGVAELVLDSTTARDRETYQSGLDLFRDRDNTPAEDEFLADREGASPPAVVTTPT